MRLRFPQCRPLLAAATGHCLKAHRDIEGHTTPLRGEPESVNGGDAQRLSDEGLVDSSEKLAAAIVWLTAAGRATVAQFTHNNLRSPV